MDPSEDLADPPTSIDPYAVLEVEKTASEAEIKSAYKKLALRRHPDKAPADSRPAAHKAFQELAFAYAILSEPRRRARYDRTGSTAETLDEDDDDFDWVDFFRSQFREVVTADKIADLKRTYQGSDEETADVLKAFTAAKGNLDRVFEEVLLSSVLDDEQRFRAIIDAAIERKEVEAYDKYINESDSKKERRRKKAEKEAAEAEEAAEDLGIGSKLGENGGKGNAKSKEKKKPKKSAKSSEMDLAALIQQRQAGRAANFLDNLEAKYGGGAKRKNGALPDEPSEDAFAEMGRRAKKSREASAEAPPTRSRRKGRT